MYTYLYIKMSDSESDCEPKVYYKVLPANEEKLYKSKLYDTSGLFKACTLFGMKVYNAYKVDKYDDSCQRVCYAVMKNDLLNVNLSGISCVNCYGYGEKEYDVDMCALFNKDNLNFIKEKTNDIFTYTFQKFLFPDLKINVTKKLEFEVAQRIISDPILSTMCSFKSQQKVIKYKVDLFLSIKPFVVDPKYDPPCIAIEIDEDGHKGYDGLDEKVRSDFLSIFYTLIRIPVKRGKPVPEETITEAIEKIKKVVSDIIIDCSDTLTDEQILEIQAKNNIDKDLGDIFFAKGDGKFSIPMNSIATFFGYSNVDNYREFRKIINKLDSDDYLETNAKNIKKSGGIPPDFDEHGKTKKVFFSRMGFYKVCLLSRKPKAMQCRLKIITLYEAVLNYLNGLRMKKIKHRPIITLDTKINAVQGVIERKITRCADMKKLKQLNIKLKEQDKLIKDKNAQIEELKQKLQQSEDDCRIMKDKLEVHFIKEMAKNDKLNDAKEKKKKMKKPVPISDESSSEENDVPDFSKMTVAELRKQCSKYKIKNYSAMKKAELVEKLIETAS